MQRVLRKIAGLPKVEFQAGSAFLVKEVKKMLDFSLINLLLTIVIIVPIAIVLTGLVGGSLYAFYLLVSDIFSHFHHRHSGQAR